MAGAATTGAVVTTGVLVVLAGAAPSIGPEQAPRARRAQAAPSGGRERRTIGNLAVECRCLNMRRGRAVPSSRRAQRCDGPARAPVDRGPARSPAAGTQDMVVRGVVEAAVAELGR